MLYKIKTELKGAATPEDMGKAIKRSYAIASIGLMILLTGVGIGVVILAIGTL